MSSRVISDAKEFYNILRSLQDEEGNGPFAYEENIQLLKTDGDRIPVLKMYRGNEPVFIYEKATRADGLRTGETEWVEALESVSALQDTSKTLQNS
ncbi:uncharacterized protein LOC120812679 isoform X2 [Gasterosteus aculeatus]